MFGQLLDRLDEIEMVVLHQKTDSCTVRAATEAMIELLGGTDAEGGGLLVVKRAAGDVIAPSLFQGDACVNDLDDIRAGEEIIDEVLRDPACHGPSNRVTVEEL